MHPVKDYAPLAAVARFSTERRMDDLSPAQSAARERLIQRMKDQRPRLCVVCAQPLKAGERKVHREACAHEREIQLQRDRRRRRRPQI